MRDAEHLALARDRGELLADDLRDRPADAGVDLVEDEGRRVRVRERDGFEREHDARQLAARGDARERATSSPAFAEKKNSTSSTPSGPSGCSSKLHVEPRVLHAELGELGVEPRVELLRRGST